MQEFKGQLKGFPPEVVKKMLENQIMQGNPRNIEVFEKSTSAIKSNGGFNWDITPENNNFWRKVIDDKNWNIFFNLYPKTIYPKVMLVSNDNQIWKKRVVVIAKDDNRYISWGIAETLEQRKEASSATVWKYAKDLPEEQSIKQITLTEIQTNFLLNQFFISEDIINKYPEVENIARTLLTSGKCIVAGTSNIWFGGVGNFINVKPAENTIGCSLYTFDLNYFLSSMLFRDVRCSYLKVLNTEVVEISKQVEKIKQLK